MTDTPMLDAYLRGQSLREAFQDLTPQQINDMDLGTSARLTGRSLKVQPEPVADPAPEPRFTETVTSPDPAGIDPDSPEFRELSPSYRASNPEGARQWVELHHKAVTDNRLGQKPVNDITWAALETLTLPVQLITGDADLYSPPSVMRLNAEAKSQSELEQVVTNVTDLITGKQEN